MTPHDTPDGHDDAALADIMARAVHLGIDPARVAAALDVEPVRLTRLLARLHASGNDRWPAAEERPDETT